MPEVQQQGRTDEELARQLVGGDELAFEELVDRHQRRIRTLCWRISGSIEEAEDLTQETFLRVFRHRDAYQLDRPFHTWLKRICVNVCLTHRERQRRRGVVLELNPKREDAAASARPADPQDQVVDAAAAHSVKQVIDLLSEPFRTTLVLRVFGGLSYQEIADELGCSLGTVMSRINRARLAVKTNLKDIVC